jgi:DNA adenine methylase
MDFMTAKEASEKWDVLERRVKAYCSDNDIPGAKLEKDTWLIPKNAAKPSNGRLTLFGSAENVCAKPFLKWAGGKSQILDCIRAEYPKELGKSVTKYAEPFVGGGAVLFDVLSRYDIEEAYVGDANRELVATYAAIRDEPEELTALLKRLEKRYLTADEKKREELFYANRRRFNELKVDGENRVELAALFVFLNRTCFNGLYRVNSRDEFNVPRGRYKNPTICDETNLKAVSEKLKGVTIVCADYRESAKFIDNRTFAYFDPPYRPLTATSRFTSYAKGGFDDKNQAELARFIDEISETGARVVASNSDPKNTDERDNFFDELYSKHTIARISARRAINSVGTSRGEINELLIFNTREGNSSSNRKPVRRIRSAKRSKSFAS